MTPTNFSTIPTAQHASNASFQLAAHLAIAGSIAALIAAAAWRARKLTPGGAIAATVVGAMACAAGFTWGAVLVVYFALAVSVPHLVRRRARSPTPDAENLALVVDKAGARDVRQVIANGGVFATALLVAALIALAGSSPTIATALDFGAAGALAVSAADTWATEIGSALGGAPRLLFSRTTVRRGMSGGVTSTGLLGSIAGATSVGATIAITGLGHPLALAVLVIGPVGALLDSALGETVQERRRCPQCQLATEQRIHVCGAATVLAGGIRGIDNDVVNLFATLGGCLLGSATSLLVSHAA